MHQDTRINEQAPPGAPRHGTGRPRPVELRREELALVYPAYDTRGAELERILSWTRDQTLSRKRYRVIVVVDSEAERENIAPHLAPQDEVVVVPDGNDVAMWNAGARRAATPWLVMTEGHCIAAPDCLESLARWIASEPNAAAGNCTITHPGGYRMAGLSERWFSQMLERWKLPGEWDRLHRAGFVIRAETFEAAGGFVSYGGQFSVPLLAASLNEMGAAIADVPGASVVHQDSTMMRPHHVDTADYARGECEARSRFDPVFFERYFGHDPICANRHGGRRGVAARMLAALIAALIARPRVAFQLLALAPELSNTAILGPHPRIALGRLSVAMDEFLVDRCPLPRSWLWHRYLRAHARVIDLTRRAWALRRARRENPPAQWQSLDAAEMTPDLLIGTHGLERARGTLFRWSQPVCMLRLEAASRPRVLRIETAGLRGNPAESVICALVDGRPLARDSLTREEGDVLRIALPASLRGKRASEVILVSEPLRPSRHGSSDPRWLGLPLGSCTLLPAEQ